MIQSVWLIPMLPLLGVIINLFFGEMLPRKLSAWLATALVGIGAVLSAVIIFEIMGHPEFHGETVEAYRWITVGDFSVNIAFYVDQLSALMLMVVTGVGFLIHMYSIGYMDHDPDIRRYFIYLNLFIFAMLMLVLGDNYLLLFLGWEGVGLCSYLLISFWYTDLKNAEAGKKAFIVNRIGDFAVLLAIFLTWTTFGTLTFTEVFHGVGEHVASASTLTAITLLFFIGCTGKSAQIPLFVWLPDAMAGPTPVSALIHAATMVTAGVYLLVRSSVLLDGAPFTQEVIAWIGVLTAFFAATVALTQTDIKKVLAYSTVSQLGYMFLAVGVGAYVAAVFHLFTHAFFKALLFLGSGSVMHAMEHGLHHVHEKHEGHNSPHPTPILDEIHDSPLTDVAHESHDLMAIHSEDNQQSDHDDHAHLDVQDMRNMGGLWSRARVTAITFLFGGLALAGFPLTAGFFSKDEILTLTQHGGHNLLYIIGLLTAFMTAFYTFRQFFMIFWGEPRSEAAEHASESPALMTIPLVILSLFALGAGVIFGYPLEDGIIHHWLHAVIDAGHGGGEYAGGGIPTIAALLISSVVSILGIGLAYLMYGSRSVSPDGMTNAAGGLYRGSLNKWYIDEIYGATFIRFYNWLANASALFFDKLLIDGAVNGLASLFGALSQVLGRLQTGFVRSYAMSVVVGLLLIAVYFYSQVNFTQLLVP